MALRADSAADPALTTAISAMGWHLQRTAVLPLEPRGSGRTFTRIRNAARSAMVIQYGTERKENSLYVQNARFLKKIGVPVPEILVDLPRLRLTVVEDVGDTSLLRHILGRASGGVLNAYKQVLRSVIPLHHTDARIVAKHSLTLEEPFSERLYRWEHELFAVHYLSHKLSLGKRRIRNIMEDLARNAEHLSVEPQVLIHRDLQSTNVFFYRGRQVLVDFQGMRLGPAMYDLASLLCDPYVSLSAPIQEKMITWYARMAGRRTTDAREAFFHASVQRLVQAIGAYGRLSVNRDTAEYARYFEPAIRMLGRALSHLDGLAHLKTLVSTEPDQGGT